MDEVVISNDPKDVDARMQLLRDLIIATHRKDKEARRLLTAELDAQQWADVSIVISAATQVAVNLHHDAIMVAGREEWVKLFGLELIAHHSDWMRLQPGQITGMLRSAFGNVRLALTVPKATRCRLQATMVEYMVTASLELRDVFEDELDDLLIDAVTLASRRAFADEFEGD